MDNSLDACEEARILPNIRVQIDRLKGDEIRLIAQDNGPGIPGDAVEMSSESSCAVIGFMPFVKLRASKETGVVCRGTGSFRADLSIAGSPKQILLLW